VMTTAWKRLCPYLLLIFLAASCSTPAAEPDHLSPPGEWATTVPPTQVQILTPAPTSTPSLTATTVYIPQPPPVIAPPPNSTMTDALTTDLAGEKRSTADSFTRNIFERPYTSTDMVYVDYLDIGRVISLAASGEWIFVSIPLAGAPPADSDAQYAVELDVNTDGRGDWLLLAPAPPSSAWTQDGLLVLIDSNGDVGGVTPSYPDTGQDTDGFDALIFNQGDGLDRDAAWVRRDPDNSAVIQFAFKHGLIAYDRRFLWRVIASGEEIDPSSLETNDQYTLEEAGSPLSTSPYYPILALAEIDSSCRWSYGFTPLGSEPGICGGTP